PNRGVSSSDNGRTPEGKTFIRSHPALEGRHDGVKLGAGHARPNVGVPHCLRHIVGRPRDPSGARVALFPVRAAQRVVAAGGPLFTIRTIQLLYAVVISRNVESPVPSQGRVRNAPNPPPEAGTGLSGGWRMVRSHE